MTLKTLIVLLITGAVSLNSIGQKLPKVQVNSVCISGNAVNDPAPQANVKFEAYNPVDRIFYTIANNDDELYLTIRADDAHTVDKITRGGITFTINPAVKGSGKNVTGNTVFTFPILKNSDFENLNEDLHAYSHFTNDTTANRQQIDSVYSVINKHAIKAFQTIQVSGIKALPDSLLSIKNKEGITASASFGRMANYIYRLVIPLKQLDVSVQAGFRYNIKLSGPPQKNSHGVEAPRFETQDMEYLYSNTPTDFWGEYILAKK